MRDITRRQWAALGATAPLAAANRPENLLAAGWPPDKLAAALLPRDRWHPFAPAADRAAWAAIPGDVSRRLIADGERWQKAEWPALPATVFLEFKRIGNRSNYEALRGRRRDMLRELVIAECLEGHGRFLDAIANGLWSTFEETYWGLPAHIGVQKAGTGLPDDSEPTIDLFAAETSALVAWIDYLLADRLDSVSPLLRARLRREVDRRILTPGFHRNDFGWMGLDPRFPDKPMNNWNPWINSNWLVSSLLLERDPARRAATVHKIVRSVDRFLASYDDDGGCDEGPGYWFRAGGSLFDTLETLRSATGGAVDFFGVPLVQEIGKYIYRAHLGGDWFVNFADASARLHVAGDLVYRYGQRIADPKMQAFGAWAAARSETPATSDSIGRQLPSLFDLAALRQADKAAPLERDVWLPGIQVMVARPQAGSPRGLTLAAQGGHNAESHNHNDVGNFIVYAGGEPAVIDVGVETYSAKTFSAKRYEIWTMQSAYHNLPAIGGVMQAPGREYAARDVRWQSTAQATELSLDIAGAYPKEAGLKSWRRTLRLDRQQGHVEVRDQFALTRAAPEITWTLMSAQAITVDSPGVLRLGNLVRVRFDASVLQAATEEIKIQDKRLAGSWGERLWRILLRAAAPAKDGDWSLRIEAV